MEVHHHPKHVNSARTLKEYVFEFLVIFIAIAGSYMAENIREFFADRHKEYEYLENLLANIVEDVRNIDDAIIKNSEQEKGLDSLLLTLKGDMSGENLRRFYSLNLKYTGNCYNWILNTSTLNAIMKSGALNLIKDKDISDGIVDYDNSITVSNKQAELLESRFINAMDKQSELVDFLELSKLGRDSLVAWRYTAKTLPALLSKDRKQLNGFYFNVIMFKGSIHGYILKLKAVKNSNKYLSRIIKEKIG
jgi:hypothetical protein